MSKLTDKQIAAAKQVMKDVNLDTVFVFIDGPHMYSEKANALIQAAGDESLFEPVFATEQAQANYEAKLAEQAKVEAAVAEEIVRDQEQEKEKADAEAKADDEGVASPNAVIPETTPNEVIPETAPVEVTPVAAEAATDAPVVPSSQGKKKK